MGIHSFFLILSVFLAFSFKTMKAYDLLLDRNFGQKKQCMDDLTTVAFISNMASPASQMSCQYECQEDSFTSRKPLSLYLIINQIGLAFQLDMANFKESYSYIQFEITYIPRTSDTLQLDVQTNSYDVTSLSTNSIFEDISPVLCGSQFYNLKAFSVKIPKSSLDTTIPILFSLTTLGTNGSVNSLRSVVITRNCAANCQSCSSDTSCSTCIEGFSKYTMTSGDSVCEIVGTQCSSPNCARCSISGSEQICRACLPGYTLNSSAGCDANSTGTSCNANQYYENNMCTPYSTKGYVQNSQTGSYEPITQLTENQIQLTFKCPYGLLAIVTRTSNYSQFVCRCFVSDCSWCSTMNTCDLCKQGYTFSSSSKSCVKGSSTNNSFVLKQTLTDYGYEIRLKFSSPLMYSIISLTDFQLTISDFTQFTANEISMEDNSTFLILVRMSAFTKNKDITVKLTNSIFIQANILTNSQYSTRLEAYLNISQADKDAAETAQSVGMAASSAIVSSLLPIVIISNFSAIVSTIDLTGFLYYLLYIDARFPINVTAFYAVFKNFQLDFIPNPFYKMVSDGYMIQSDVKFMQTDTDAYFLSSTGQSVFIFLILMAVYVCAKIIAQLDFAFISAYFKKSVYETWEYGGFFDAVWTIYIYLIVGVFMQYQEMDCGDTSCAWNYTIFAISNLVALGIPIYVAKLLRDAKDLKENEYMKIKISSLIAGVRLFSEKEALLADSEATTNAADEDSKKISMLSMFSYTTVAPWREKYARKWTKYYMAILYFRKIIFAIIIVGLNPYGYLQLSLITILNIGMTLYFLLLRPLDNKYENYKGAISEIVMMIFQALVASLLNDPETEEESNRIAVGWVAISLISLVILWHTIGIIIDFFIAVYHGIRTIITNNKNKSKVSPINSKDSGSNDDHNMLEEDTSPKNYRRSRNQKDTTTPLNEKIKEVDEESIDFNGQDADTMNQSPVQRRKAQTNTFSKRQSIVLQSYQQVGADSSNQLPVQTQTTNNMFENKSSSPFQLNRSPTKVTKKKTAIIQMISNQAAINPLTRDIAYDEVASNPISANQSFSSQQDQGLLKLHNPIQQS